MNLEAPVLKTSSPDISQIHIHTMSCRVEVSLESWNTDNNVIYAMARIQNHLEAKIGVGINTITGTVSPRMNTQLARGQEHGCHTTGIIPGAKRRTSKRRQ